MVLTVIPLRNVVRTMVPLLISMGCSSVAMSAPLDSLLRAESLPARPGEVSIEGGYDAMNETLDFLNIRDKDPKYAGSKVGDYRGEHLRLAVAATEQLWLNGDFWRRGMRYASGVEMLNSWQIAMHYNIPLSNNFAMAVRGSMWRDYVGQVKKTDVVPISGYLLQGVTVRKPEDSQWQLTTIATWSLAPTVDISGVLGGGISTIKVGALEAGYNGCYYAVSADDTSIMGDQIGACGKLLDSSFKIPTSFNLFEALEYDARFLLAAVNLRWRYEQWTLTAGYLLHQLNREHIEGVIEKRGDTVFRYNKVFDAEIALRANTYVEVFMRGEVLSNHFIGEVPFGYNVFSAKEFYRKYGLLTFGLRANF